MHAGIGRRLEVTVVGGSELGWWNVADGAVEALGVPPVDPAVRLGRLNFISPDRDTSTRGQA